MSSIHSIFIDFPFPLGALISILIYMHTALNRQGKRFAIIMGLIGFTLTAIPTYQILRPIKQFYLYVKTNDIQEIEVNSMNLESEEKLLQRISDPHLLSQYIHLIQKATAIDHPPYLYHPYENMIFLHCKLSSMDTNIYIQKNIHGEETLYLGSNWVPYEVKGLYDTIFSDRPSEAQKLLIKDHKNNGSTITDGTIINSLWSILPWLTPVQPTGIDMNLQIVFEFSNDTYINGSISSDFTFLSINNEIYQLPYYLSNDLHKQYLLNRLTQVPIDIKQNQNISKEHAHTTVESDDFIFSIDPIIDSLGYGIYKTNKMNKKKELIFPLPTNDISMELIRDQYLLLYIESARNIGDILLVKTSDPYFKRYIENKKIYYLIPLRSLLMAKK